MKRLTIKQKIILWFSLTLLVIIGLISVLTFFIADLVLDESIKDRLAGIVSANAQEIEYSNGLENREIELGDQFLSYNGGWLEIDDDFCEYFEGICVALYDQNGELLYGEAPLMLSSQNGPQFTEVDHTTDKGEKYYIYDKALSGAEFEGLWLRGIVSYKEATNILYNVVRLTFWLLPLLAILAILGGYFITRRSFLPVQQLAESAEEIGRSGDLSKRIDIGAGKDELHMLADAFNNMFDRLQRNFEAERSFTSDASHELRTPTAVILAQSQYGLELAESEADYRESLEVINRQAMRMNQIISQLLLFTRLEQGTEPIHLVSADLSQLTQSICNEQKMLSDKNIQLLTDIQGEVTTKIDVSLYSRMVNNLINNAYKYGHENGHIIVRLELEGSSAVLSIADDGIGISQENLEKIWARFYQVDNSRSEAVDSGVGLGLAMVQQIAGLLGGTISVKSKDGEGTTFIFKIKADNAVSH